MNKNDLEALSDTRLNEAKCLLDHGFFMVHIIFVGMQLNVH